MVYRFLYGSFLASCACVPEPGQQIVVLANGDALRKDAAEYAKLYGVSLDEALRRPELQRDIGKSMVKGSKVMTKLRLLVRVLPLFALTVGCSSMSAANKPQEASEIFFLHSTRPTDGFGNAGLLEGILELSERCLVIADSLGTRFSPIWPNGYSYKQTVNNVEIMDGSGKVVARVGERVGVGGGEFSPIAYAELEKYVSGNLDCPKPFWDVVAVQ